MRISDWSSDVCSSDWGRRAQGVDAVLEVGGSGRRRLPRLLADIEETVERRDALAIPGDQRIFVPRLCGDLGVADDHAGCFDDQCAEDWCVLVTRCCGTHLSVRRWPFPTAAHRRDYH